MTTSSEEKAKVTGVNWGMTAIWRAISRIV